MFGVSKEHRLQEKHGKNKVTREAIKEIARNLKSRDMMFTDEYDKKHYEESVYIKHYLAKLHKEEPVGVKNWIF